MSIIYNGTTIKKLIYNDTNIQNGYYGSTKIFGSNDTWRKFYINYNWGKYNCVTTYGYEEKKGDAVSHKSGSIFDPICSATSAYCATSYTFDSTTGKYTLVDPIAVSSSTYIKTYRYVIPNGSSGSTMYYTDYDSSYNLYWEVASNFDNLYVRYSGTSKVSYNVYTYTSTSSPISYSKGDYIEDVSSTNSSAYPTDGPDDSHTYWYVYTTTSRGAYIDSVEAESGTYPDDGIQNGYWYVKIEHPYPDPPTDYESVLIATWNSASDVDAFFATYNYENGWAGLKLGNLIQINDGTFNVQWEIAGFNLEHDQIAADGTMYDNGYGICLIPKRYINSNYNWHSVNTSQGSYINSDIHSYINGTAYNALNKVCGSHIIINRNVLLGSELKGTSPRAWTTSAYTWTTAYLTLMSIGQMTNSFAANNNKYDDGEANYYLPVFDHEDYRIGSSLSDDFWSRCVQGAYGDPGDYTLCIWMVWTSIIDVGAGNGNGVRPLMYLR